jgi:hypothetical protein
MVGHWGIELDVTPPGGREFQALVLDKAEG